ncbi:MAG: hypothetical protein LQ345_005283, partial [Seirophora villosa]
MVSFRNEGSSTRNDASSAVEWQEPPLRAPAPSFEDYKGLERQGVLEYMQPLGTFPSQRVKLRLKAHDPPPKRSKQAKNGEHAAAGQAGTDDMSTPDPAPAPPSRRSESRKSEDKASRRLSSRGKDEDSEYRPNGPPAVTPSKTISTHSSQHGTPSSRNSTGTAKLSEIVDSAVEKSKNINDPILGMALRKLYRESTQNLELFGLLHAVLQQTPTDAQRTAFQKYIKRARKEVMVAESDLSQPPSQTPRASSEINPMPVVNHGRTHTAKSRTTDAAPGASKNHDNKNPTSHPHSPTRSTRNNAKSFSREGSSGKQQAPPNRARRASSTSSLSSVASSLSSVDANLALKTEEDLAAAEIPLPSAAGMAKSKAAVGPKMGTFTTSKKRSLTVTESSREDEELAAKRRKLTKTFPDYVVKDSDMRTHVRQSVENGAAQVSTPPAILHPRQSPSRLRNGTERSGAAGDDSDGLDSPATSVQSDLLIPPPPFAGSSRRGATPTNLGRPPKAGKKSARVKMSPLKKRNGVVAGMPRPGGGRHSPIGSNVADGEGVNSDECSACGGTGKLLCCDGCTRSYHFTCVDPPQHKVPDGEWFCHFCAAQPTPSPERGIFVPLQNTLQKKKPVAFNLPIALQDYYEDVVRGDDGEYEEANVLSKAKTRNGYDVPTDTLRLRDNKDQFVLCYKCGKSAMGNREIADCDFCNLHWHLDCLDPPLASAPKRFGKGNWKCPAHVDSEITLPRSASGKVYKVRKPKNPRVIDTALRRGIRNNGNIEIEDEFSEEEEQPPGVIYRIPARGLTLDFITKVKQDNMAAAQKRQLGERECHQTGSKQRKVQHETGPEDGAPRESQSTNDVLSGRSLAERQAAMSLMQFAESDSTSQLSGDRVEQLIGTLM